MSLLKHASRLGTEAGPFTAAEIAMRRLSEIQRQQRAELEHRERLERFMAPLVAAWWTAPKDHVDDLFEDHVDQSLNQALSCISAVDAHMEARRIATEPRRAPDALEEVKAPAIPPIA